LLVAAIIFSLAQPMFSDCIIVALLLFGLFYCWDISVHHIQSLVNAAMATIAYTVGQTRHLAVTLLLQPQLLFTVELKDLRHCWLLSSFELSLIKVSAIKLSYIKLGSGTSNKWEPG
jgi:hypothetical protein